MNEAQKKEIAAFRYSVIADLVQPVSLSKEDLCRLIRQKVKRQWQIPYSDKNRISESTIRRWLKRYNDGNKKIESLFPKNRGDSGDERVITDELATTLLELRKNHPNRPVIDLADQARQMELVPERRFPALATLYRFFKKHDRSKGLKGKIDRRRFEAEFPNDLWQSDVMYGLKLRIDGRLRQTYLIAFLDDHSRLIPHAAFYLSENLKCFLEALKCAVQTRGIPRKLYVDNGPAFRSKQLRFITASLAISLVHARPYTPQGKGKIERFFRTVRKGFLSGIDADRLSVSNHPLPELNEAFETWLYHKYQKVVHSSTSQTPLQRFSDHIEMVRPAPSDLKNHFRQVVIRTVTKDRVVHLNGNLFETPVDLVGERVELLCDPDDPAQVSARFQGKNYRDLIPVDLGVNVRAKRQKDNISLERTHTPPQKQTGCLFGKNRRK